MSRKKKKVNKVVEVPPHLKCEVGCFYFPDMTVEPNEWVYDEQGLKRRKEPKVFRCVFDNHIINWNIPCPAKLAGFSCCPQAVKLKEQNGVTE